ncbi:unnamed protein product [Heterobilharzia americana]|nr:unnamed protein product [Heterobilharzia americana]
MFLITFFLDMTSNIFLYFMLFYSFETDTYDILSHFFRHISILYAERFGRHTSNVSISKNQQN